MTSAVFVPAHELKTALAENLSAIGINIAALQTPLAANVGAVVGVALLVWALWAWFWPEAKPKVAYAHGFVPLALAVHHLANNTVWGRRAGQVPGEGWRWVVAIAGSPDKLRRDGLLTGAIKAMGQPVEGGPPRIITADEWSNLGIDHMQSMSLAQTSTDPAIYRNVLVSWENVLLAWPPVGLLTKFRWRFADKLLQPMRRFVSVQLS